MWQDGLLNSGFSCMEELCQNSHVEAVLLEEGAHHIATVLGRWCWACQQNALLAAQCSIPGAGSSCPSSAAPLLRLCGGTSRDRSAPAAKSLRARIGSATSRLSLRADVWCRYTHGEDGTRCWRWGSRYCGVLTGRDPHPRAAPVHGADGSPPRGCPPWRGLPRRTCHGLCDWQLMSLIACGEEAALGGGWPCLLFARLLGKSKTVPRLLHWCGSFSQLWSISRGCSMFSVLLMGVPVLSVVLYLHQQHFASLQWHVFPREVYLERAFRYAAGIIQDPVAKEVCWGEVQSKGYM